MATTAGEKMRLDKALVQLGVGSRREVQHLISQGEVSWQGSVKYDPQEQIVPQGTLFVVAGRALTYTRYVYYMLHKKAGYLSATQGVNTVLELLRDEDRRPGIFPVGRLDKDSEGLLLISNQGELAHRLLAPKRQIKKSYLVRYLGELDPTAPETFAAGIVLPEGERCLPAELIITASGEAQVIICEGKYHQVKRMLLAVGGQVTYLRRLTFGTLQLDPALTPGTYRPLTLKEVEALYTSVGLN
ncbi:MAG: rRNA pseudouridine synthase, partial [Symbiobacteriaceae bacterium]|nr:rRNA pseudouridine synthase [Symbiobacteriaceae bacterium]